MSGRARGRAAHYRAKYGGGRGAGSRADPPALSSSSPQATIPGGRRDWDCLHRDLAAIDGQQYGAYKRLQGKYEHLQSPTFTLSIDHVQGDAYASPSKVRAIVPWKETGLPDDYLRNNLRRIALCDFVTRVCADAIRSKHMDQSLQGGRGWTAPKGGTFNINAPGQEILPRTSAVVVENAIELRFTTVLPAAGRTILGAEAHRVLAVQLVDLVARSLLNKNLNQSKLHAHVVSMERQSDLRAQVRSQGFLAFVANGSILPRASGASTAPMDKAVPFQSPSEMQIEYQLSDGSTVAGMAIPRGITLLTGGGFHGKSTLLKALEMGIYNHIPGDGRELVVTDPTAVKIRAEDGRRVMCTDISPFISNLPGGRQTTAFDTEDASGSTSMAANIQEALEAGCKTLLIDEDTSATNLLVRDERMRRLVYAEPIEPLISKAKTLYLDHGVSTIIVIGGLGDWLSVADNVLLMDEYVPHCATAHAKRVVKELHSTVLESVPYGKLPSRRVQVSLSGLRIPFAVRKHFIALKPERQDVVQDPSQAEAGIDLSCVEQIVEIGQTRMLAALLRSVQSLTGKESTPLQSLLEALADTLDTNQCPPASYIDGDLVSVRRFELAAALSRMRMGIVMKTS